MLKKILIDIRVNKASYEISQDLHSNKLGEFYLRFEDDPAKLNLLIHSFDEQGIPLNSAYVDVENPRLHYYPISIGQYALEKFNRWINTGDEDTKLHFLRIADWFYENRIDDDKLGTYWLTDIPKPEYKVNKPWKSAFTQSRAISVLLRSWQVTGRGKYFTAAKNALIPFTYDIEEGGVSAFYKSAYPIYEEYVAEEPTAVLDGHNFSLLGLYDFLRAVTLEFDREGHELATNLFNKGIVSLIKRLPDYDMGYWLKFNLCEMKHYPKIDPCTVSYLRLVLLQLEVFYRLTENKKFINYKNKFSRYDSLFNILRMYPVKYKALKKLNRV